MTGTVPYTLTAVSPAGKMKPRLGFVGVGWIGHHRLEAIATSGIAQVTAVHDLDSSRTDAVLREVDAKRAATLEELFSHDLDGVVIATPNSFHAEQSLAALEQGMAVFCQKPLARTGEEVRTIVNAARRNNRLLGVDLSYRHTLGMQKLREVVASGELGEIYAAELVFHNAYGPDKPWFYDVRLSGGGCIMDLGIHLIDLALWVFGFPKVDNVFTRLYAGGSPLKNNEQVEDYATVVLDMANGATTKLSCSWNLSAGRDAVIAATFYGTKGGISFHNVDGSFYDFTVEIFRGTRRETICSPPDNWGGRGVIAWATRLATNKYFDEEAMELLRVSEIIDRIYAA